MNGMFLFAAKYKAFMHRREGQNNKNRAGAKQSRRKINNPGGGGLPWGRC